MEEKDISLLLETSRRLIDEVSLDFRRYLCPQIEWNDRLICIKGPKGRELRERVSSLVDVTPALLWAFG